MSFDPYILMQRMWEISQGNPGAIAALAEYKKQFGELELKSCLNTLVELDLLGSYFYMLWNDCCIRDINKVKQILDAYNNKKIKKEDFEERIKSVGYGLKFDDLLKEE